MLLGHRRASPPDPQLSTRNPILMYSSPSGGASPTSPAKVLTLFLCGSFFARKRRGVCFSAPPTSPRWNMETTQGQIDGFLSELIFTCYMWHFWEIDLRLTLMHHADGPRRPQRAHFFLGNDVACVLHCPPPRHCNLIFTLEYVR